MTEEDKTLEVADVESKPKKGVKKYMELLEHGWDLLPEDKSQIVWYLRRYNQQLKEIKNMRTKIDAVNHITEGIKLLGTIND